MVANYSILYHTTPSLNNLRVKAFGKKKKSRIKYCFCTLRAPVERTKSITTTAKC